MNTIIRFIVLSAFLVAVLGISAQKNERDRGIELYKKGNIKEAVAVLEKAGKQGEFKGDAELWNYLGLAYIETDDNKKARNALEKAVKLRPETSSFRANLAFVYLLQRKIDNSQREAEKALEIDPKNVFAYYVMGMANLWEGKLGAALADSEKILSIYPSFIQGYLLKSEVLIAQLGERVAAGAAVRDEIDLIKKAAEVLELGQRSSSAGSDAKLLEDKLEGVRAFYKYYSRDPATSAVGPPVPDPSVTPLKITAKPRAVYTNNARGALAQGTIRIAVLFGANGSIQHLLLIKRIGYGLDESALNAARQIQFTPQMKDGKPVSVVKLVEYNFTLY